MKRRERNESFLETMIAHGKSYVRRTTLAFLYECFPALMLEHKQFSPKMTGRVWASNFKRTQKKTFDLPLLHGREIRIICKILLTNSSSKTSLSISSKNGLIFDGGKGLKWEDDSKDRKEELYLAVRFPKTVES